MEPSELSTYRLSASNCFAPPDRRYQICTKCLTRGCRPSFRDDKPTWEIFRFLRKRDAACEPWQRFKVRLANPGLSLAFDLHHGKARILRPIVEAYVLATADDNAIATRLVVPTEAIHWFRLAYFDVEHLRHSPHRILHEVIGVTDEEGQSGLNTHRLWKLIGFLGNPEALDQLLNGIPEAGLADWIDKQTQICLKCKQLLAAHTLNVEEPMHLDALAKIVGQQRDGRVEDAPLSEFAQGINTMLAEMPWIFGEAADEAYNNSPIGQWDKAAVELHDEELHALAAGKELPELDELRKFKLPQPRKQKPKLVRDEDGELAIDVPGHSPGS